MPGVDVPDFAPGTPNLKKLAFYASYAKLQGFTCMTDEYTPLLPLTLS